MRAFRPFKVFCKGYRPLLAPVTTHYAAGAMFARTILGQPDLLRILRLSEERPYAQIVSYMVMMPNGECHDIIVRRLYDRPQNIDEPKLCPV